MNNEEISEILELQLKRIEDKEYMIPTIDEYNKFIDIYVADGCDISTAHKLVLNDLSEIMWSSKESVDEIIERRIQDGIIINADQARVSVAGQNFQRIVVYSLINNVFHGNLPKIIISLNPKKSNKDIINNHLVINVLDHEQKPDCDLLIYDPTNENSPIVIGSCKTSLRERAGQAYRWKLLYDLAKCQCEHIENCESCPISIYGLNTNGEKDVKFGLITGDFHDEIYQPQIRGMMAFFDYSLVTKPIDEPSSTKRMDTIIEYLNSIFSS